MYQDVHASYGATETLSQDALRMRLRRLCELKAKSGKSHVDEDVRSQYTQGGSGREWLEMALLESLQQTGLDGTKGAHKRLVAPSQD